MQQDIGGPSLERVLGVIRRRGFWILLCFVLAAGAAFGLSKHQTKKYTATASLVFNSNQLTQQIVGLPLSISGQAEQNSNVKLIQVGDMAAKTANQLGQGLTAQQVSESLSVAQLGETSIVGESSIVDVSASVSSPTLAAKIANTYVERFVSEQQLSNHRYFTSALAIVSKQLKALSPAQRLAATGGELQSRAQALKLLAGLQYGSVRLAQKAVVPTTPSSPSTRKNTLIGGVLGLLVGLGLALLLERLDRRIRYPEDLEAIYGLPMLGSVPESAALSESAQRESGKRAILPFTEAEAFSLIRAHLRFFNVDRDPRMIVIASAAPGDGKTTIARRLAEAAARLGSQVLLLEVDLRHPTLAQQLDIERGPGMAEVLTGAISMGEAIRSVVLKAAPGEGAKGPTLDVLTAGSVLPPNPGELAGSRAMETVLEQVKSAYDFVVIDTPPLNDVSDAFPLLTKVDGVVIVGWVGRSRRDAAEQLQQVLARSAAPLLGVIANGSKSGGPRGYPHARGDKSSPVVAAANGTSSSGELVPTAKT